MKRPKTKQPTIGGGVTLTAEQAMRLRNALDASGFGAFCGAPDISKLAARLRDNRDRLALAAGLLAELAIASKRADGDDVPEVVMMVRRLCAEFGS